MTAIRHEVRYLAEADEVTGWFYPGAGAGPRPGLVFCPGFTGTKFAAFYLPYVEAFVAAGWSVLLSDYRGWGESAGPRGEIVPLRQVEDLRAGLAYLRSRADVDGTALSLFGVSFGGGNAVTVAGRDPRVRSCIVVSPVSDGEQWLHEMRREYEWQEFLLELEADELERAAGLPGRSVPPGDGIMIPTPEKRSTTIKGDVPAEMVPGLTPLRCARNIIEYRPIDQAAHARAAVLVFCVERDATVPAAHGRAIFAAVPGPRRLVTIDAASHYGTYTEHFTTIIEHSLEWLETHGRAPSPVIEQPGSPFVG